MYVEDLKRDFYNILCGYRVLLFVNLDVDAICACKILQSLFKCDDVAYTLVPVGGVSELKTSYEEHCEEAKHVVLVNCGGTVDLVELLQPAEDIIFFIADSHKPTDVCNIYSNGQVRVIGKDSDEAVPDFDDIFRDDEDEEENENVSENEEQAGENDEEEGTRDRESEQERRTQRLERRADARRQRRLWEQKRDKLMFDYTQFSYYSRSTAVLMFELAWTLSKDSLESVWWAIVGATEQLTLDKIELPRYVLETGTLQSHVTRLSYNSAQNHQPTTGMSIRLEKEARLALYRHWNVESSLRHSPYTSSRLRLWTLRGDRRLHQLLADMGLPLGQARQAFGSMDIQLRKEFLPSLEGLSEKYSLPEVVFLSFSFKYGYRNDFSATDVVYALLAILEHGGESGCERFQDALDSLSVCHEKVLRAGVEAAKMGLISAHKQVQTLLQGHSLQNAGPFLYLTLPEGGLWGGAQWLGVLGRWALRCRSSRLPLIAAATLTEPNSHLSLVLGLPPLAEDSTRNLFGRAFEQAAIKSNVGVSLDHFDTSVVSVETQHLNKFLDALTALLS